jgi:hypothetical protein
MDEHQTPPTDTPVDDSANPTASAPGADETFGWTADDAPASGQASPGTAAERMVSQLQSMIDSLATQAAPVVRQVGLKAAELAAAAADRAGPIAHKAADATAEASVKIAERSRVIAADFRRDIANATDGRSTDDGTAEDLRTEAADSDASTAVAKVLDDVTEQSENDDPGGDSR